MTKVEFKDLFLLETRKSECAKILTKYPDRVPAVLEKINGIDEASLRLPDLSDNKYLVVLIARFLVRRNYALFQFQAIVRFKLKLQPAQVLYLVFPSNTIYSGGIHGRM